VVATSGDAVVHFALHYIASGPCVVYERHTAHRPGARSATGVPWPRSLAKPRCPRRSIRTCVPVC